MPPQKLPTWKSLCAFLDRNQQVFIDPKSNDLIRKKFASNVPSIIKSRQININNSNQPRSTNGYVDQQPNKSRPTNNPHQSNRNLSESSSKSPPPPPPPPPQPRSNQPTTSMRSDAPSNITQSQSSSSRKSKAPSRVIPSYSSEQELLAQQQAMLSMLGVNPFANLPIGGHQSNQRQLSPNSAQQLQGLQELLAASGATGNSANPLEQMQSLQSFMALMAQSGQQQQTQQLPGFNPFMIPPFGGAPEVATGQPGLADLLKMMGGGKLPPGMDMNSFEELAATINSQTLGQQQQPDSPSTKSTSSNSSGHEKSKMQQQQQQQQHRQQREVFKNFITKMLRILSEGIKI